MANKGEEDAMKDLIKQYLDHGMSRRQLMTGLSALGMSTVAARSVALPAACGTMSLIGLSGYCAAAPFANTHASNNGINRRDRM